MEEAHDDRFVVYLRNRRDAHDPPEDSEWPIVTCSTYEEACRVRLAHRMNSRDCIIRYVGPAGGGD